MLLGISIVIGLQMFITYNPTMNMIMRTSPIRLIDWVVIIIIASSIFFLIELEKFINKIRDKKQINK